MAFIQATNLSGEINKPSKTFYNRNHRDVKIPKIYKFRKLHRYTIQLNDTESECKI